VGGGPGLLLLGDAAHVISPVGGNGILMAIQDAVAAANRMAGPLRHGAMTSGDLAAVQADQVRVERRAAAALSGQRPSS
jgi:2-polyprenyl-6-methoxyphenol hydroxylase-like FAD-dependent oxidoreductase